MFPKIWLWKMLFCFYTEKLGSVRGKWPYIKENPLRGNRLKLLVNIT